MESRKQWKCKNSRTTLPLLKTKVSNIAILLFTPGPLWVIKGQLMINKQTKLYQIICGGGRGVK